MPSLQMLMTTLRAMGYDLHDLQDALDDVQARIRRNRRTPLAVRVEAVELRLLDLEKGFRDLRGAEE